MDGVDFDKIINDVKASFLMESLKLSDKVISNIREIYVDNKSFREKSFVKKRRRIVRYEFKRK